MPLNGFRGALTGNEQKNEALTVDYGSWTTTRYHENATPIETPSHKNGGKSITCRKRSAPFESSFASEPERKTKKKIELVTKPSTNHPVLNFGQRGYFPVLDGLVLNYGRYKVQKMLGNGAYATVHLAKDRQTGGSVAVKIARTGEFFNNASNMEIRFMKTARNASRSCLDTAYQTGSENIVSLIDDFQLKGPHGLHTVMVMEVLGPDLLSILCNSNQQVLTVPRIRSFSKNILEGLLFLHLKCRIMHLDLKPENLFVTIDLENMDLSDPKCLARLKIGDFGTSEKSKNIVCREVQTCHYRAPEAFLKSQITSAADIWSVGCIIYEMVTRELLFPCVDGKDCNYKWHCCWISKLLGPIKMRYFERNKKNMNIFHEVFGNQNALMEKPLPVNRISSRELMKNHPLKKDEAEEMIGIITELLTINPDRRPTAWETLTHSFFTGSSSR